jgi:hypothetical protein
MSVLSVCPGMYSLLMWAGEGFAAGPSPHVQCPASLSASPRRQSIPSQSHMYKVLGNITLEGSRALPHSDLSYVERSRLT